MTFVPVNEPLLNGNEKKYLIECINSGWISSEGPNVTLFENQFAQKCDRKYGIAVANGSVALDLALVALGLSRGDEVILPTFTIISCIAAIIRIGATPVLVDSDFNTWNMDVSQIESKITEKTRAIMVVHLYGLPVDMTPVLAIAKRYNLKIIEDAAEAHGQRYQDKSCGSFGDVSTFSFYPNKHITTGEGGMVLTNSEEIAEKCRDLRNLSMKASRRFIHDNLGWNYRMTNLQAAIGLAQLERLDEFIEIKKNMGKKYTAELKEICQINLPVHKTVYADNNYWVYGLVLRDEVGFDADEMIKKLNNLGVGSRPFFWPMHEQPILKNMGLFKDEIYPNAEKIARRGFYIPSGLALTHEQLNITVDSIKTIFSH